MFVSADSKGLICTKTVQDSARLATAHSKGLAGVEQTGTGVPCPYKEKSGRSLPLWACFYPSRTITDWIFIVKQKALGQLAAGPVLILEGTKIAN
jgi:hypothetical protein